MEKKKNDKKADHLVRNVTFHSIAFVFLVFLLPNFCPYQWQWQQKVTSNKILLYLSHVGFIFLKV